MLTLHRARYLTRCNQGKRFMRLLGRRQKPVMAPPAQIHLLLFFLAFFSQAPALVPREDAPEYADGTPPSVYNYLGWRRRWPSAIYLAPPLPPCLVLSNTGDALKLVATAVHHEICMAARKDHLLRCLRNAGVTLELSGGPGGGATSTRPADSSFAFFDPTKDPATWFNRRSSYSPIAPAQAALDFLFGSWSESTHELLTFPQECVSQFETDLVAGIVRRRVDEVLDENRQKAKAVRPALFDHFRGDPSLLFLPRFF